MPATPLMKEDHISQVPALQLLQNLGWTYLPPSEALDLRGGRTSSVILDGILEQQLRLMNRIRFKGEEHPFSEGNIHSAIQALKDEVYDGLIRTNEKLYDLLCLGKSLQQSIAGDLKSFSLHYINWENPERNVYHVTEEFTVERTASKETYRPDIVLFVNGIPLAVIECKRTDLGLGKDPIVQAISQHIRNQKDQGIPKLFLYSQLLIAASKNAAKYATTGTPAKFWAAWKEPAEHDAEVMALINRALSKEQKDRSFSDRFAYVRKYFDAMEAEGGREVTEQDRAVWALCRPQRLLELGYRFLVFDAGEKKIARYQQYFCVTKIMGRIRRLEGGKRQGGVVWHTQGSGKSLTMVMLAKAIALEPTIENHRIVLVTDRVDLDDQIYRTFKHCGIEPEQATTGANLVEMLESNKKRVITTVINKFEAAVGKQGLRIEDPNVFVLVDEGHRTQFGPLHAKMRKVLPNACYIGFTGTPVVKKNKNTLGRFGGLIDVYTITQAVNDGAVVPLLYEGRHVAQTVNESIDNWFERITDKLTKEQKRDLKKKFASTDQLNKAEQKVMRVAWDISEHFRDNWQGTPFKAQLVAQDKATALRYKHYLDEFGMVSSEVLISGPDEREGEDDLYSQNKEPVIRFWKGMMEKYGTEKEYNRQIINAFLHADQPEIIIVVDKLLTGFDAPRNTVLYLTRQLKEHSLLQAIARVNRLHDGKEFGYILDYRGVLENLDQALDLYSSLDEFDKEDLAGTVTDVGVVIQTLPQKHSDLWDLFKGLKSTRDEEAYELLLADDVLRVRFYDRFGVFARTLAVAASTLSFQEQTAEKKVAEYQRDLKFFKELRQSVRRRYAETVAFSEYEPKIQKLIDTYVGTGEVEQITGVIDLFNKEQREKVLAAPVSESSKADTIAHNTKRVITEKWQEDPAFYKKFSELLEEVIRAFHEGRIQQAEYSRQTRSIMKAVINRTGDEVPQEIRYNDNAKAYYGCIKDILGKYEAPEPVGPAGENMVSDMIAKYEVSGGKLAHLETEASLAIDDVIQSRRKVNWTADSDTRKKMEQDIEDKLLDLAQRHDLKLSYEAIDEILDQSIAIASVRCP